MAVSPLRKSHDPLGRTLQFQTEVRSTDAIRAFCAHSKFQECEEVLDGKNEDEEHNIEAVSMRCHVCILFQLVSNNACTTRSSMLI